MGPPGLPPEPPMMPPLEEEEGLGLEYEFDLEENIKEGEVVTGEGKSTISLTAEHREELARRLEDIVDAYGQMMQQRLDREEEISNAYNLIPDVMRGGQHPGAARLCSSLLRRWVTSTSSRLAAGMMENRPWMSVGVSAHGSDDPETVERLQEAEALQRFLDSYVDTMELAKIIPEQVNNQALLGTTTTHIEWLPDEEEHFFRDIDESIQSEIRRHGRVKWTQIRNRDMLVWPLTEKRIEDLQCIGHRRFMLEADFKEFFKARGVESEILDEIAASEGFHRSDTEEKDLERQEIRMASHNPFDGQVEIYQLHCHFRLPGKDHPLRFLVFYHHPTRTVLWIGHNTLHWRRPPYFRQVHWEEPNSYWGAGIGQDGVFHQAADTAMWNMEIDNLKIVGNFLIQVPAGGEAEANTNELWPGKVVVVDEGEEISSVQMGGTLEELSAARQRNSHDGAMAVGVPSVLEGTGDPVMKSGATASAHQSLIAQASHRPGQVDRNMREAYSEMFMFSLLLIQQYAPEGVFFETVEGETAELLVRTQFRVPSGDLQRNFRITVSSPSAATNREAQQQQILLIWNFAKEQAQLLMEAGQSFYGDDAAGLQEALHDSGKLVVNTFRKIIELHDVPGLEAPVMDDPTPIEEQYNELMGQFQELQQQMQQMQEQQQQAMGGAPQGGQAPPSGPPGGAPPSTPPQGAPV